MKKYLIILLCVFAQIEALKLNRVILATDANPDYIEFWPIVAKAWKEIVGLKPTLALIAHDDIEIDETLGEVLRFKPLDGIPTSFQAQVIRLFLPALFPDDGCILSDIDMIPLNTTYFTESVASCPEDSFVVYRDQAYTPDVPAHPMCYVAAQGSTFGEVFNISSKDDITHQLETFYSYNLGWCTDELMLYDRLVAWKDFNTRCVKLGHGIGNRVNRVDWQLDRNLLRFDHYIDAHCPRPYSAYKDEIDSLLWRDLRLSNIPLYPHNDSWLAERSAKKGNMSEEQVIRALIKPGNIVFAIGAGSDTWTNTVCDTVESTQIHVFSQNPFTNKNADQLFSAKDTIKFHDCIVSDKKGESSFYYYPYASGKHSSLYRRTQLEDKLHMHNKELLVCTDTLDLFCIDHAVKHMHFLKISAEGAEYDILKGAEALLMQNDIDFIQFDYSEAYLDAGKKLADIFVLLQNHGYELFKICQAGLVHMRTWKDIFENYQRAQFIAVSRSVTDYSLEYHAISAQEKRVPRNIEGTDATHMMLLLTAAMHTTGPILEMGVGDLSTPLLHAICSKDKRYLVSADTSRKKLHYFNDLCTKRHIFQYIPVYEDDWSANPKPEQWDAIDANIRWSVVLINHRPGDRRVADIQRLRNNTDIFVIHDTQESGYNYKTIIDSFKYRYVDERYTLQTTLVSDTIDVSQFFI